MLIKKILIGIDNSPFAEHAAKYGFDIAHSFKARVGLVHIVEPTYFPPTSSVDPLAGQIPSVAGDVELFDIKNEASENLLDRFAKEFGGDLEVSLFNEFGDTADGIIHCCEEFKADMIVIGTHSRHGLDRLLSGSIAEHVVRHAEVPVLVVPFKDHS